MRARATWITATLTAIALAAAGTVDAKGYGEDTLYFGFLYDDPAAGYVATAGVPIEGFCPPPPPDATDVPPPPPPGAAELRVFSRSDGTETLKSHGQRDVAIFLYEFAGPAPVLIGQTCEAMFDGDPVTVPPVPVATGSGLMKFTVDGIEGPEDMGGFSISNSINGTVTAADGGSQMKVRGWADYALDDDGAPIGDPAEFQGVEVRHIRRGQ